MPHIRQLASIRRLRAGLTALVTTCAVAASTLLPAVPVQAYSGAVVLNFKGYTGSLTFRTTQHSIGTCNGSTWPSNSTFTANSGKVCEGNSFGPLNLYLSSVPSGYRFDGFTVSYKSPGVTTSSCGSQCQYMEFSGTRSLSLDVNFTKLPTTPAPPSAPQPYISNRTASSIAVSWPTPTAAGGINHYLARIMYDGTSKSFDTSANSYNFTGLTCAKGYSFLVKVYDNHGQVTTSNTISTSTTACPVSTSTPAPAPTPPPSNNTSNNSTSTNRTTTTTSSSSRSVAQAPATTQAPTGTSSTTTTNDTLGTIDLDDAYNDSSSSDNEDKDDDKVSNTKSDKKGPNNLTKILIGLGAIVIVVGLIRWIYLRQANQPDQYWT